MASSFDGSRQLTQVNYSGQGVTVVDNLSCDAAGQVTSQTDYQGGTLLATITKAFNNDGDVTSITAKNVAGATIDSFTYGYDAAQQVTSAVDFSGTTTTYGYDNAGQLTSAGTASYAYDGTGNLNATGDVTAQGNIESTEIEPTNLCEPAPAAGCRKIPWASRPASAICTAITSAATVTERWGGNCSHLGCAS